MRIVGYERTIVVPDRKVEELVEAGLVRRCQSAACRETGAVHPASREAADLLAQRFGSA